MRKKLLILLCTTMLAVSLTACADDNVKVIKKPDTTASDKKTDSDKKENSSDSLKGYIFTSEGVSLTTDIEAAKIIEKLGEPKNYFEAASCAFNGLDKVYTYAHFEINTYPDGDKDIISNILFLDDMVATTEGVSIGMTKDDMEAAYGKDYKEKAGMYVYTKDGMHLSFLVKDGVIASIEYGSAVLDE